MVGRTKPATTAEKKRMSQIREIGCIACLLKNWPDVACEVHHVVEGSVRLGHSQTMGLCVFHHRGHILNDYEGYTRQAMMGMLGPSLAHGSRHFSEEFGSQATLVAVQDYIIQRFTDDPWLEFSMPRGIILDIFYYWSDLRQADATL